MKATALAEITIEHLGTAATAGDLDLFVAAVRAAIDAVGYETPPATLDEDSAIDWLWNDGDWHRRAMALIQAGDDEIDGYAELVEDCRRHNAIDAEAETNPVTAWEGERAERAALRAFDHEMGV